MRRSLLMHHRHCLQMNYQQILSLNPGSNAVTAATGGSGGAGFDYGALPVSKRFNFTLRTTF